MKKVILLLLAAVLLGLLVVVYVPFTPAPEPMVGSDRDTHGCIPSAGYTYSEVRGECIRVWEAGTALAPVVSIGDPALPAYVVQGDDGKLAEVFLPGFEQGLVMNRDESADVPTWTANGHWTLTYDPDQGWKFFQDGELVYASKAQ